MQSVARTWLPGIVLFIALAFGINNPAKASYDDQATSSFVLAQSVTTGDSNTATEQPRIISRPQTVDTAPESSSAENTISTNNAGADNSPVEAQSQSTSAPAAQSNASHSLPEWMPTGLKNLLHSYLDPTQLDFVGRYFLWLLIGLAVICLLPFFLIALASDRKRNRHHTESVQQQVSALDVNEPIEFDDLDLPETLQADDDVSTSAVAKQDKKNVAEPANNTQAAPAPDTPTIGRADKAGHGEPDGSLGTSELDLLDETQLNSTFPQPLASADVDKHDWGDNLHEATLALDETALDNGTNIRANDEPGNDTGVEQVTAEANSTHSDSLTSTGQQARDSSALQQPQPLSRFGMWLSDMPQEEGSRAAIEAFMYWVRYGAGHIKPGLAEALSAAQELDDHGRIKRAVLSFRPEILHDILLALKIHLDPKQYMPVLDMMLAILINGSGIKPVENLLLRYYADFIGIGSEQLDFRYRKAHGKPLPNIPRPDRMKWWKQQPASDDQQPAEYTLLGIDDSVDAQTLDRIRRLAEFRHSPERFGLLGDRERALIARNLEKYHAALDSVMEVTT